MGFFDAIGRFFTGDTSDAAGGSQRSNEPVERDAFGNWNNEQGEVRQLSTTDRWAAETQERQEQQQQESSALSWGNSSSNDDQDNNRSMYRNDD